MPFTRNEAANLAAMHDFVQDWGKIVSRRVFGEIGPGLDRSFADMEQAAVVASQAIAKDALEDMLEKQAAQLADEQPCPTCGRACQLDRVRREIVTRGGRVTYNEPVGHCPACRRDFFPSAVRTAAE